MTLCFDTKILSYYISKSLSALIWLHAQLQYSHCRPACVIITLLEHPLLYLICEGYAMSFLN